MNQKEKEYSLYAAYGSNVNCDQMRERCPDAKFVQTGILENHRFVFADNGVANIVCVQDEETDETPIAIYAVSKFDLVYLDKKEGRRFVKGEETGKYRRVDKRAKGLDEDLICYVLNEGRDSPAIKIRDELYADTIISGLKARKMKTCHVYRAIERVKQEWQRINDNA